MLFSILRLVANRNMANETTFKGLQIFPQNLAKQQRRQIRDNGK